MSQARYGALYRVENGELKKEDSAVSRGELYAILENLNAMIAAGKNVPDAIVWKSGGVKEIYHASQFGFALK